MLKLFASIATIGVISLTIASYTSGNPTTVQAAATTSTITNTTSKVQEAATRSNDRAASLGTTITTNPSDIPDKLRSFTRSTAELHDLREQLANDLTSYADAATKTIAAFDEEAGKITDENIKRNMTTLRRKTIDEQERVIKEGNEVINHLDTVLQRGKDLSHAANCIRIATTLHDNGSTITEQLALAQKTATDYHTTTNTLLAKIDNTLASK